MTDATDAERKARSAIEQLVDATSEAVALDVLDDIERDVMDPGASVVQEAATDGGQVAEEPPEFSHEFDVDERRTLTENGGVLVNDDGYNVQQDVLGTVEVTGIDDGQMVLDGDTYDAKETIKAIDYNQRDFDGDRKVWLVDTDAAAELHRRLNEQGFLFTDAREADEEEPEAEVPVEEVLDDFVDLVDEGDRIRVTYEQKNGNGLNDKEGTVRRIDLPDEEYVDATQLVFRRDDEQVMYVDVDYQYGTELRLRTSMSHAPFVGNVVWLEVLDR